MNKILLIITLLIVNVFANPKILMVATNHQVLGQSGKATGLWLSEFVHAYNEFDKADFKIVVAAPKNKSLPIDPGSIKLGDDESLKFLADGKKRALLNSVLSLSEAKKSNYDAIYLVGGHGVMWDFAKNDDLKELLSKMAKRKDIISGVCHGVAGLINVKNKKGHSIIDGIKLTGFSNTEEKTIKLATIVPFSLEDELIKKGAIYSQGEKDFGVHVVIHKNFITGQNPESSRGVAQEIVKKLKNK